MISYILKFILCSGILLLFYHLFLEKEKMHRFNRFYLLASIVFTIIIPLITVEIKSNTVKHILPHYVNRNQIAVNQRIINEEIKQTNNNLSWFDYACATYYFLTFLLLGRLLRNFYTILIKRRNKKIVSYRGAKLVLMPEKTVTYTFLNNIFVEESAFIQNKIEKEILTHELAHVRQKTFIGCNFLRKSSSVLMDQSYTYFL